MKIHKLFSIRIYDGKRDIHKALKTFLKNLEQQADIRTRILWDEESYLKKLTSGTCILIMLGSEICGLVDYHAQPLNDRPKHLHPRDTTWISDLVILPQFRRLGLGKMLMDVVCNFSRYLGKKYIRTFSPNHCTGKFLITYGFSNLGQPGTFGNGNYELSLRSAIKTKNETSIHFGYCLENSDKTAFENI